MSTRVRRTVRRRRAQNGVDREADDGRQLADTEVTADADEAIRDHQQPDRIDEEKGMPAGEPLYRRGQQRIARRLPVLERVQVPGRESLCRLQIIALVPPAPPAGKI